MSWTEDFSQLIPDGEYPAVVSTVEFGTGEAKYSPHLKVRYELIGSGRIVFGYVPVPHWVLDSKKDNARRIAIVKSWFESVGVQEPVPMPDDEETWNAIVQNVTVKKTAVFVKVRIEKWGDTLLNKVVKVRTRP